ncbi:MAG: RNA polymerase sigma factor SigJ [Gemmatimonadota bacterium]|nr:RNA polymerase sigma factor SigJ [Gemmatimonadota bacterium]
MLPDTSTSDATTFEQLRPTLFGLAYRMLGEAGDADDIVQDAYLRYAGARDNGVQIDSLRAYLTAIVTRLAIDHLRSARVRREEYSGLWLPEPLLTDGSFVDVPHTSGAEWDSLSMAFLLLLERLNPVERAVFLLHDVFDYTHTEVAGIIGKTETNCRRIASRARKAMESRRRRFVGTPDERERLASTFFAAVSVGDVDSLIGMLASDVVVYGDGGGNAPQWSKPIVGESNVARLLAGLGKRLAGIGGALEVREVNGDPGAIVRDRAGRVISVFMLELSDNGAVQALRSVINPEKLGHLGPVADVWALARE